MELKFYNRFQNEIKTTQSHIYISPSILLRNCVAHYTIMFGGNQNVSEKLTLIPDASGCLVFEFDGNQFECNLFGASTKSVIVNQSAKESMMFFIEFLPGGLYYVTGITQTELIDLRILLCEINRSLNKAVIEAFENSVDLDIFITKINKILIEYISERFVPKTLHTATKNIQLSQGRMTVKQLSEKEFYSERHLNRIFKECMGMSVKTFSKLIRINKSIQDIKSNSYVLSDIAQEKGFYDQSHFIHDFKSVCGMAPKKFMLTMSDFYNEPFKF